MGTVTMNQFAAEPEVLIKAELAACERVIRSGWWVLGNEVANFEKEWAHSAGAVYAVGCGNGLDALEIGLRALGLGPDDEVVTTPMTAFATVLAVLRAGAKPVLADIDPATAMVSPESVKRCITPRTRAILLVHLYGQIGPVEELLAIANQHGIYLIEDCAQAHGAELKGRQAGTFGAFAAWSFYPTKNLGAVGDAGALTTSLKELAVTAAALRNYGQTVRYHHPLIGMNSRLDELQAAILRERLRFLSQWTVRRREISRSYAAEIKNPQVLALPLPNDPGRHVHHLFVVICVQRQALQLHLRQNGIESLIHYPIPIHQQDPCRNLVRDPAGLGFSEHHAQTCLSLPCHPGLTDDMVQRVVDAVNQFRAN
jgi:dTDP-4-amino-4,6-dideoxygalactose transaminase